MQTVADPITCKRCGAVDTGNFCSECGSDLNPRHPIVRTVKAFTAPIWEFAELFKDVVLIRNLVEKVRSGRIDYHNIIPFTLASAAVTSIGNYLLPGERPFDGFPPFIGELVFCSVAVILGMIYHSFVHIFLRKYNPAISYAQALTVVVSIFCVSLPVTLLADPDKATAGIATLQGIFSLGSLILIIRGMMLLYRVTFWQLCVANFKSNLLVFGPIVLLVVFAVAYSGISAAP